jgi:hypothetical protein
MYLASVYFPILSSNNIYAQIRERMIIIQVDYIYSNVFLHHFKRRERREQGCKESLSIS